MELKDKSLLTVKVLSRKLAEQIGTLKSPPTEPHELLGFVVVKNSFLYRLTETGHYRLLHWNAWVQARVEALGTTPTGWKQAHDEAAALVNGCQEIYLG